MPTLKQPLITYLDAEEKELIESYEKGEYGGDSPSAERIKILTESLRTSFPRAKKPFNIRLHESDVDTIKLYARNAGIPYQRVISTLVHDFAKDVNIR